MLKLWAIGVGLVAIGLIAAAIYWIANPSQAELQLPEPLVPHHESLPQKTMTLHSADYRSLSNGFRPQRFRSFCGPASIATVLRAYGETHVDQSDLFSSLGFKANAFFSGLTLAELAELAERNGLRTYIVYADTLTLDEFRQRLVANLASAGDYVLINYDRRSLSQSGVGHISPVAAYNATTDAFLVLDQATYNYPFTWVPAALLYQATNTLDGKRSRGILIVTGYNAHR
ncbi:MAG: phytochelatin synthase family protein [Pseudomonadales bacterium]